MLETLYNPEDLSERCGIILTDGTIVEIANIAEDPSDSYDMDPEAVLPFMLAGTIKGTWHTHVNDDPNLSGVDYAGFNEYPEYEHSIIGIRNGQVTVVTYRVDNGILVVCD